VLSFFQFRSLFVLLMLLERRAAIVPSQFVEDNFGPSQMGAPPFQTNRNSPCGNGKTELSYVERGNDP
jgi:hypothetical protein